jgi:hypothetical protein
MIIYVNIYVQYSLLDGPRGNGWKELEIAPLLGKKVVVL